MKDNEKVLEQKLLDIAKQKEESAKRLLNMEILLGVVSCLPLLISAIIVAIVPMEEWLGTMICFGSAIPILVSVPFMLKIEQIAGYYKCKKCNYHYVPTYFNVFWSMHVCRTRYMKCPKCNKYSWNKKVLSISDKNN